MKDKTLIVGLVVIGICVMLAGFIWIVFKPKSNSTLEYIESKYHIKAPTQWGEKLQGITNTLPPIPGKPSVYLTFDLCMGDYDQALVEYLIQNNISATFFINSRWIDKHTDTFLALASNPLFAIQNHGTLHRPLSVNGKEVYHIKGTNSIREVYEEIMGVDRYIQNLTGKKPRYFRSGTAYYDEVAISIAKDLGYEIGGFDIIGDGGATYSKQKIIQQAKKARDGSILIYHANKPQSETFAGIREVIPLLQKNGFSFGKLE